MILADLCNGIPVKELVFDRYTRRDVNPVSGHTKQRPIAAPRKGMYDLHQRLIAYVRPLVNERLTPVLRYATAGRPGCSPVKNAAIHRKNRFFYLTDIRRAFPSVDGWRLALLLAQLDPELCGEKNDQGVLAFKRAEGIFRFLKGKFVEEDGYGIITGGPASNDLFNLLLSVEVDQKIHDLIFCPAYRRLQIIYTRYTDDLTFSGRRPIPKEFRRAVREIIVSAGFTVNHNKGKSLVVDISKRTIVITGVGVEHGGRMFLPRPYLSHVSGLIQYALHHLPSLSGKTRKELLGKVEGTMGLFWAFHSTDRNRTEQKIVDEYEKLKFFCEPAVRV